MVLLINQVNAQNTNNKFLLKADSIYSKELNEYRKYFIYIPKIEGKGKSKTYNVIYATDGQEIEKEHYISTLDSLAKSKIIPPTVLIGAFSNEKPNGHNSSLRQVEYIRNDNDRYKKHKDFFLRELPSAVLKQYNLNEKNINKKIFYGFSNGAGFGIDIYLNNKEMFDYYFCFSPLGTKLGNNFPQLKASDPPLYITYGSDEIFVAVDEYKKLIQLLKENNVNFEHSVYKGGHDRKIWKKIFFEQLIWSLANT
jgi:predicted alpha/beta superfamily hydrolase